MNAKGSTGTTPIFHAVLGGHAPAARLLLENGADPNVKDASERTPLAAALAREDREIAQLLRDFGAGR